MKTGRSLTELAGEIERQMLSKKDYLASTSALSMTPQGGLTLRNGETTTYPTTAIAARQIGEFTGVPAKYFDKMREEAPELLATNVNHWLAKADKKRMVRTLDGNVRAFLSDSYQRIDNVDVAKVALPILGQIPGLKIQSTEITERKLYIKATTNTFNREIKSRRVGDIVEAGVMIGNSEIGHGSLYVLPFFNFLWCTNGMVRNKEGMRAYHVGRKNESENGEASILADDTKRAEDRAVLLRMRDMIKAAIDQTRIDQTIDKLQGMTVQMIETDPIQLLDNVTGFFSLQETEKSSVLRHLIEGGDLSRYGLLNAITRTAEDVTSYDRATEIETIGGNLIDLPEGDWRVLLKAA